mmetsp:Transcript_25821/g.65514  ORF Transcript_25821/g.65514 Transcript_25821/m.65514 type:complete len:281 (-) Transcript_25821:222-1064(-)
MAPLRAQRAPRRPIQALKMKRPGSARTLASDPRRWSRRQRHRLAHEGHLLLHSVEGVGVVVNRRGVVHDHIRGIHRRLLLLHLHLDQCGRRRRDRCGQRRRGGCPANLVVERRAVALVQLGRDVEREGDQAQHFHLEVVHLEVGDAAHARVVGVVVVEVVEEFAREHHTGYEQAVDVERRDDELRVVLDDEVHVDQCEDHRLLRHAGILEDPVDEVVADTNRWRLGRVEGGNIGRRDGQLVVAMDEVRQQLRDHLHDALGAAWWRSRIGRVSKWYTHALG